VYRPHGLCRGLRAIDEDLERIRERSPGMKSGGEGSAQLAPILPPGTGSLRGVRAATSIPKPRQDWNGAGNKVETNFRQLSKDLLGLDWWPYQAALIAADPWPRRRRRGRNGAPASIPRGLPRARSYPPTPRGGATGARSALQAKALAMEIQKTLPQRSNPMRLSRTASSCAGGRRCRADRPFLHAPSASSPYYDIFQSGVARSLVCAWPLRRGGVHL